MSGQYTSSPWAHLVRMAVIVAIIGVGGYIGRTLLLPATFGQYGPYRGAAVHEEIILPARHMTNDSCLSCHPDIKQMHLKGIHRTVSCEFCHGTYADHVKDGKKVAALPVKRNEEITRLCLRCHNQIIRARPKESIKMVSMPQHLEQKQVKTDHTCAQCHNVHAPMMWINMARTMMGFSATNAGLAGEVK